MAAGCGPYLSAGKTYRNYATRLRVDLPEGWLQFTPERPACVITKDGFRLETISIRVTKLGKKLPATKRVYRADMLPHEIAQLSLGLMESSDEAKDFQVQEIQLAKVAGHNGYKACASFVDKQGLRKRLCLYGAVIGDSLCELRYTAAEHVYYERYLPAFEQMVVSAKVL